MNIKYSDWQKVDLHIHTDWSKDTKNGDYAGEFSVEILYEKLVEQDVRIFSLTDHNIINLPAYKKYYEDYTDPEDPLLLLGIELDIERDGRTYHSLLIFNYSDYEKVKDVDERLEAAYKEKDIEKKKRSLTVDEIISIFPNDDYFFIPHAGNTNSIIDCYKGEMQEAQEMIILFQSPLEKVSEERRQVYNKNFDTLLYEAFQNRDDYAYIEFSDNHNIIKYPCTHKGEQGDHEFYYIKGSKNYETIRLAFIDPESRIKSSSEFQRISQSRNYIERLEINSSQNIEDNILEFSPSLNVIIGGRSSGKSLLMDLLNRSIDTLKKDDKYDCITEGLNIKIKSKYDSSENERTNINTSIIQINQGDIIKYFETNNLKDLAKKAGKGTQYDGIKESFLNKKDELQDQISALNRVYKTAFDLDITKRTIIHNHTIEKILSEEFLISIDTEMIEKDYPKLEEINKNKQIIIDIIDSFNNLDKAENVEFNFEERKIYEEFKDILNKKIEVLTEKILTRKRMKVFFKRLKTDIKTANAGLSAGGQEKAQAQESINGVLDNSKLLFESLNDLKESSGLIEAYDCLQKESFDLNSETNLCLEVKSYEEISDIIIEGIKDADDQSLYLCLLKLLYDDSSIKNYGNNEPESLRKKINSLLSVLLGSYDNPNDYLEYGDDSNSKNRSPGYNSEKYLEVILKNSSSNLILIDQPEDNLGNKFISEELVELIRKLKFNKQIFIVTHNPAIVVYGDAESIILAKNDRNKISYSQIKLETEQSQRDICGVLDGGEYIFDNRSRKYNIQKLLRGE